MKKFAFRFLLIAGTLAGIAYLKKDVILDALIKYSIDIDCINNTVDDVIDKAFTVKDKVKQTKETLAETKETFNELSSDISDYSTEIKPIVDQIKNDLPHE